MHPAQNAERLLDDLYEQKDVIKVPDAIAMAQVYATLALANAIEGLGMDIKEGLGVVAIETSSIAQALDGIPDMIRLAIERFQK